MATCIAYQRKTSADRNCEVPGMSKQEVASGGLPPSGLSNRDPAYPTTYCVVTEHENRFRSEAFVQNVTRARTTQVHRHSEKIYKTLIDKSCDMPSFSKQPKSGSCIYVSEQCAMPTSSCSQDSLAWLTAHNCPTC